MPQTMTRRDEVITGFREILPAQCATAQAIDRHEPWERIALNAVNDGYIESPSELAMFIEVCLHRRP